MNIICVNQKKVQKGFTLIEVLVVTAIIGILASIMTLNFLEARELSRDKIRMSSLKELQVALELYKAQNGRYPEKGCGYSGTQWVGPGDFTASPWGTACDNYINALVPNYIPELPKDPQYEATDGWGFIYQTDATGSAYKVLVHGSVEKQLVQSYSDEFARCPYNCNQPYCSATPPTNVYGIYSKGAECW